MTNAVTDSMDDIWLVQLPNGTVRAWSLEELDAEFQKGTIDESTLVRQGAAPWSKLSVLLGLDEAPPASGAMAVAVSVLPPPPSSLAPMQLPSAPPPPVVTSFDVDLDFIEPPRSRKRSVVVGLVAAALVLCGGVFALTKVTSGATSAAAGSIAEASKASIAQVAAAPMPPPAPIPQATAQLDAPKGAPLTDLQKKALALADKNRERAAKEAKEKRAKSAPPRRAPRSASPFHKGGNKSDPLNSAL
jgi:hypothetical protein